MLAPKIDTLLSHMAAGRWPEAIKFAARFPELGEHKADIQRAKDALLRPHFYRQIRRDPAELVERGKAALISRYAAAAASARRRAP